MSKIKLEYTLKGIGEVLLLDDPELYDSSRAFAKREIEKHFKFTSDELNEFMDSIFKLMIKTNGEFDVIKTLTYLGYTIKYSFMNDYFILKSPMYTPASKIETYFDCKYTISRYDGLREALRNNIRNFHYFNDYLNDEVTLSSF